MLWCGCWIHSRCVGVSDGHLSPLVVCFCTHVHSVVFYCLLCLFMFLCVFDGRVRACVQRAVMSAPLGDGNMMATMSVLPVCCAIESDAHFYLKIQLHFCSRRMTIAVARARSAATAAVAPRLRTACYRPTRASALLLRAESVLTDQNVQDLLSGKECAARGRGCERWSRGCERWSQALSDVRLLARRSSGLQAILNGCIRDRSARRTSAPAPE
jgi:hypothetical protein